MPFHTLTCEKDMAEAKVSSASSNKADADVDNASAATAPEANAGTVAKSQASNPTVSGTISMETYSNEKVCPSNTKHGTYYDTNK